MCGHRLPDQDGHPERQSQDYDFFKATKPVVSSVIVRLDSTDLAKRRSNGH